jgi:hypothetical protein
MKDTVWYSSYKMTMNLLRDERFGLVQRLLHAQREEQLKRRGQAVLRHGIHQGTRRPGGSHT